jgi:hypothetical protein
MATMMTGLDATTGPFVAFLDAVDTWTPEFLDCHVGAHLSSAGNAAMSCSDLALIDESGVALAGTHPNFRRGDPSRPRSKDKVLAVEGSGAGRLVFLDRGTGTWPWSATSGMVFRRVVIEAMRPKRPERIRICADEYLARAAHMLGGSVRLERALGCYRLHDANVWAKGPFFGEDSHLGQVPPDVSRTIRAELGDRLCEIGADLEPAIPRRYLGEALIAHLGWREAYELNRTNKAAAYLLKGRMTPWRRLMLAVAQGLRHGVRRPAGPG